MNPEQPITKVRQCRPDLHKAFIRFKPAISFRGKMYRFERISVLEGKYYEAILLQGLLNWVTVVLYSELHSSVTEIAFWVYCQNDYAREGVNGHQMECKALYPFLHSIMEHLTVHDLSDELRSINNGTSAAYDFNNKKDFHILTDVLNKAPHVLIYEKGRRYSDPEELF